MNSLSPSFQWLHLWANSTKEEKYEALELQYSYSPTKYTEDKEIKYLIESFIEAPFVIKDKNSLINACNNLTVIELVSDYLKNLIQLIFDLVLFDEGRPCHPDVDLVLITVRKALLIELSLFSCDIRVLYHAKNSSIGLLEEFIKDYSLPEKVTFEDAKCNYRIYDRGTNVLKSVNYSLFGNFGYGGESTFYYWCFNFSQAVAHQLAVTLGLENSLVDNLEQHWLDEIKLNKPGILELYHFPFDNEEHFYDSGIGGTPTGNTVSESMSINNTFNLFNSSQARIFNYQHLTPIVIHSI